MFLKLTIAEEMISIGLIILIIAIIVFVIIVKMNAKTKRNEKIKKSSQYFKNEYKEYIEKTIKNSKFSTDIGEIEVKKALRQTKSFNDEFQYYIGMLQVLGEKGNITLYEAVTTIENEIRTTKGPLFVPYIHFIFEINDVITNFSGEIITVNALETETLLSPAYALSNFLVDKFGDPNDKKEFITGRDRINNTIIVIYNNVKKVDFNESKDNGLYDEIENIYNYWDKDKVKINYNGGKLLLEILVSIEDVYIESNHNDDKLKDVNSIEKTIKSLYKIKDILINEK